MPLFLRPLVELHLLWRLDLPGDERGSQPYNVHPKAHLLQHLIEDQLEQDLPADQHGSRPHV